MPHLTDDDIYYWKQGTHTHSYERLGAHPNQQGTWFAVWAPNAERVEVTGDFNDWSFGADVLERREGGLWEGYVRGAQPGQKYKYHLHADGEWVVLVLLARLGAPDVPLPEPALAALDRKSTRLNSSHITRSRMPSSA